MKRNRLERQFQVAPGTPSAALALLMTIVVVAGGAKKEEAPGVRELGKVKPKELNEISGIAASRVNPEVLWVSNDGETRWLYAIFTSGKQAGAVKMPTRVDDVEDLSIGVGPKADTDYLYIGDVGDNDLRRFEVAVVRFPEPTVNDDGSIEIDPAGVETFRLGYPDGAHNAEAIFIDPASRTLCLVTKDSRTARLYEIGVDELQVGKRNALRFVMPIEVDNVSAGAISRDGSRIVLRREDQGWLWQRQDGQSVAEALRGQPQAVRVLGRRQGKNGEAVSFRPDGERYLTVSEGKKQAICEFDISAAEPSLR